MEVVNFAGDEALNGANEDWKVVKCPYCFGKLKPFDVSFRAETVMTKQDWDEMDDSEKEKLKDYVERKDTILEDFWKQYPKSKPEGKNENHAVLNAHGSVDKHIVTSRQFALDDDDFPYAMMEPKTGKTTMRRICPYCHNELPHEYGKYPVSFISVVGITGSGKTVYISQLLDNIDEYLTRANLVSVGIHDVARKYVDEHKISKGKALPAGTTADKLTLPLPINVQNRETNERHTLVFFDIAGENCVNPEQMRKFGPFIVNADSIIMIIDPKQFSDVFELYNYYEDNDVARPEQVVNAMYNAFLSISAGQTDKSPIPLAVTISKSDMLQTYYRDKYLDTHTKRQIQYGDYGWYKMGKRGFAVNDFRNVSDELKDTLYRKIQGETFINSIEACFNTIGYFAVSALNCDPTEQGEDGNKIIDISPERVRVEEPFYWMLFNLGLIGGMTRNNDYAYKPFNPREENGGKYGLVINKNGFTLSAKDFEKFGKGVRGGKGGGLFGRR